MNTVLLIGTCVGFTKVSDNNYDIRLKVKRDFKDVDGNYHYDIFNVRTSFYFEYILDYVKELSENDIISVSGRLQVTDNNLEIIAHKIQLLGRV